MILQGKARAPVREVVLHCAAIRTGQFAHMGPFQVFATVNRWHTERGFKHGFGYHGLFMPDGTWYSGRPFTMTGAHVLGHNTGTLGFLLIESQQVTHIGRFDDWFTAAQAQAVKAKLREIDGIKQVSGHNDYAPKLCPGFHVESGDWL
ncbi:hypothetical protein EOW66_14710 [Sinirhodobacter huangdaonensis]|uniref:N-acetylmuramoyl-L-alanine amidase domain-containing protein n=1 Tax=Paenirhodobacter huangdaonensis TaxID=2501515 RepID=A0A3S4MF80_9RHOB|nr:hypothetical protein EOW66_14710 [Sinirhodobacter huangdaonensis]